MPDPAALITGGTSGIGLAMARLLHERGARVMVTGRDPDTLASASPSAPGWPAAALLGVTFTEPRTA